MIHFENQTANWKNRKDTFVKDAADFDKFVAGIASIEDALYVINKFKGAVDTAKALALAYLEKFALNAELAVEELIGSQESIDALKIKIAAVEATITSLLADIAYLVKTATSSDTDELLGRFKELTALLTSEVMLTPAALVGETLPNLSSSANALDEKLIKIRDGELQDILKLCAFCDTLVIIGLTKSESEDPDEAEKHRRMNGLLDALMIQSLNVRAVVNAAIEKINTNSMAVKAFETKLEVLQNSLAVTGLIKALEILAKRFKISLDTPQSLEKFLEWFGIAAPSISAVKEAVSVELIKSYKDTIGAAAEMIAKTDAALKDIHLTLTGGSDLATQAIFPYQIWITPTVEAPASWLDTNTPIPAWRQP